MAAVCALRTVSREGKSLRHVSSMLFERHNRINLIWSEGYLPDVEDEEVLLDLLERSIEFGGACVIVCATYSKNSKSPRFSRTKKSAKGNLD